MLERQEALAAIAMATLEAPLTRSAALALVKASSLPPEALEALITRAAVRAERDRVEVIHEGLADFLRAKKIASLDIEQQRNTIAGLVFKQGAWLAPLLLAAVTSTDVRDLLWSRIASFGPAGYFSSLHYRPDLSAAITDETDDLLSRRFLGEYLNGFADLVDSFFPSIRPLLVRQVTGRHGDQLAVSGRVYREPAELFLALRPDEQGRPRIELDTAMTASHRRYVDLTRSRYRLDSGRLLSAQLVQEGLEGLIASRALRGGHNWLRHIVFGRLRHLMSLSAPIQSGMSNDEIALALEPFANQQVGGGLLSGPTFSIGELITDVRELGRLEIDIWKTERTPDFSDRDDLVRTLEQYYSESQILLNEIVEANFASSKPFFGLSSALPVRWKVTVVDRQGRPARYHSFWLPVRNWSEAGGDIEFADQLPDPMSIHDAHTRLTTALNRLGRRVENVGYVYKMGTLPRFEEEPFNAGFDGETEAVRTAYDLLAEEMRLLFADLPSTDV